MILLIVKDETIKVDIKDPDEILVAKIFGYDVYLTTEVLESMEEKFPDEGERKKHMDKLLYEMLPACRARREYEDRKKEK